MKQYLVDAFTDRLFAGNQAAVCVMENWIEDELMQAIASENNLSETAFTVRERDGYHLRWFTPGGEIDFCGHATLATSYVLFRFYCRESEQIRFRAKVGELFVARRGDAIVMDFPAYALHRVEVTDAMEAAFGVRPAEAYMDRDLLLVLDDEQTVRDLQPNQDKLKELDGVCVAVTAKGKDYDCVSRVFAPKLALPEDPVTGSTHCMIAPYWAKRLGKTEIHAWQASARGGELFISCRGERVTVAGKAVLYATADILLDLQKTGK